MSARPVDQTPLANRTAVFARLASHPVPRISRMMKVAQARGLEPVFVGGLRERGLAREDSWDGFAVKRVGPLHATLNGRGVARYIFGTLAFNIALVRRIRAENPALVHISDLESALLAIPYCRMSRIPVIYNVHDNIGDRYALPRLPRRLLAGLEGVFVRLSNAALVPEAFRRMALPRWCRDNVRVVRNAPEDAWPDGPPEASDMAPGFRVLYAGWLDEGRGIRALVSLGEEMPALDVRIAGSGDPVLVDEVKRSHAVSYLEYMDHAEVMRQVAASHVVVALYDPVRPINIMAAPNKLAEAFCAGRPVVINSEVLVGAAPEYQDSVIRVPYHDRLGLSMALTDLIADPDRYLAMCAAARRNYEAYYSWESVVDASNDVFADVGF